MARINETLRKIRLERGMTQDEVAEQVGLTRQAISSYESGRTQPGIDILERLAETYQVELTDIIYGKKNALAAFVSNALRNRRHNKRIRLLQICQIVVFVITLLYIVLIPSPEQLDQSGNISAFNILLSQIHRFLAAPLCVSSAVGWLVVTFLAALIREPMQKQSLPRSFLIAALFLVIAGIYFCIGFTCFQMYPPLTFESGLYIINHHWLVSVWWCAAAILLSLFAVCSSHKQ